MGVPSLTVGSRGLTGVEVTVQGANADLHSGMYGGAVANPLMALSHMLSSLQDENGVVQVAGFYDGIPPLSADERAAIDAVPKVEGELEGLGLEEWWGDPAFTPDERRLVRPTLELRPGAATGPRYQDRAPSGRTPRSPAAWCAAGPRRRASLPLFLNAAPGVTVSVRNCPATAAPTRCP